MHPAGQCRTISLLALCESPGNAMKALTDLFSTDYGLMSIVGIAMMLVGIIAFAVVVRHKMNQPPSDDHRA